MHLWNKCNHIFAIKVIFIYVFSDDKVLFQYFRLGQLGPLIRPYDLYSLQWAMFYPESKDSIGGKFKKSIMLRPMVTFIIMQWKRRSYVNKIQRIAFLIFSISPSKVWKWSNGLKFKNLKLCNWSETETFDHAPRSEHSQSEL